MSERGLHRQHATHRLGDDRNLAVDPLLDCAILDVRLPDPIITRAEWEPESEAMLADSVGLALLIVLDTLEPAERLAFCSTTSSA